MTDLPPRAHVFRLLLDPYQFARLGIAAEDGAELGVGEWIELLDPDDGDAPAELGGVLLAGLDQRVVELAGNQQHARNRFRIVDRGVIESGMEGSLAQILDRRGRELVPE